MDTLHTSGKKLGKIVNEKKQRCLRCNSRGMCTVHSECSLRSAIQHILKALRETGSGICSTGILTGTELTGCIEGSGAIRLP